MKSVLLTINLKGALCGPVKHTDKQIVTVDVSEMGSKHPEFISRKIVHNDRISVPCSKKLKFSEEIISDWERGECPHWEKPSQWKTMTKNQKLMSHLKRYDEGFGISVDIIE